MQTWDEPGLEEQLGAVKGFKSTRKGQLHLLLHSAPIALSHEPPQLVGPCRQ